MPTSPHSIFKNSFEFKEISEIEKIPKGIRGIYILYKAEGQKAKNVVYVGMARGEKYGARSRLKSHKKSEKKKNLWTHFSVFEVWDNISAQEVAELEGLFRHIYRLDTTANILNIQREHKPLAAICRELPSEWLTTVTVSS
jgi:hypothetical protein